MIDVESEIRGRIRKAREEAGLSQRQVAEALGVAQVTISDLERGRTRVSAADLARLATILGKGVGYFYPGVEPGEFSDAEETLLGLFRSLPPMWQDHLLDTARSQVRLYQGTPAQAVSSEPEPEPMPVIESDAETPVDEPEEPLPPRDRQSLMADFRAALDAHVGSWAEGGAWLMTDDQGVAWAVPTGFPDEVNERLSQGDLVGALIYVRTLNEPGRCEAARAIVRGLLIPHGVPLTVDENMTPRVSADALKDFLRRRGPVFVRAAAELIRLAGVEMT
ncbi:MAG: helix-turn-helix domain-containing protein [Anaerolineae bacterium]|jgi:transcriptional regulator with XRE-family HTH domain